MDSIYTPFRFRELSDQTLVVNEVGDYSFFSKGIIDRFFSGSLSDTEEAELTRLHILLPEQDSWHLKALSARARRRVRKSATQLNYLLVIPTLRCDLSCTYCQVSRASESAQGYDLSFDDIALLPKFWSDYAGRNIKIEFQGGEPTLRPDLVNAIIDKATLQFDNVEFAICTNLMHLNNDVERLLARDDMHVSTSIDGPPDIMTINRTKSPERTKTFFNNLKYILSTYGPDKISALPTVTPAFYGQPERIIDQYLELGMNSIFLRPVNYMGFARKQYAQSYDDVERWNEFYNLAMEYIIDINKTTFFEEFYTSMVFQKILGLDVNHVDFRSPNTYFSDYCVVDYDGCIYPTDEARMLSRTGKIDLRMGNLKEGIDRDTVNSLNFNSMNEVHPDCLQCTYGPFCGIDLVDDLSRYGRIDNRKDDTAFCRRHMYLFDLIFEKIRNRDRRWLDPLLSWAFRRRPADVPYGVLND